VTDRKIRTLLIEDSAFMRIVLSDVLRRDESIELLATAANGWEGVKKAKTLLPDVIITDLVMPDYDGLFVVQEVMKDRPLPVILLSSIGRADQMVFSALRNGAFDFLDKPGELEVKDGFKALREMIHHAFRARCISLREYAVTPVRSNISALSGIKHNIVVIGASTGGPSAIELIVSSLPSRVPVPVVIAQHMPERFIKTFAERLQGHTTLRVLVAADGETLKPNHIYLAPGAANVRLKKDDQHIFLSYVDDAYKEFNKPSIDCLFESAAEQFGERSIGAILTGMGKDGANGLKKIREAGGFTLSQDENTCTVYGMPKAAYENGGSSLQVPLPAIANLIVSVL
jgi:two-component system, chemotaxis family, protein-glutamate methylesterase/glutaminase